MSVELDAGVDGVPGMVNKALSRRAAKRAEKLALMKAGILVPWYKNAFGMVILAVIVAGMGVGAEVYMISQGYPQGIPDGIQSFIQGVCTTILGFAAGCITARTGGPQDK